MNINVVKCIMFKDRKQIMVLSHNRKLHSNEAEWTAAMCITMGKSQNTGPKKKVEKE